MSDSQFVEILEGIEADYKKRINLKKGDVTPSMQILVKDLESCIEKYPEHKRKAESLIVRAKKNDFDDYMSKLPAPMITLTEEAQCFPEIVRSVIEGKYDA